MVKSTSGKNRVIVASDLRNVQGSHEFAIGRLAYAAENSDVHDVTYWAKEVRALQLSIDKLATDCANLGK